MGVGFPRFEIRRNVNSVPMPAGKSWKIVATRCHILRLKCTKFDFGWGSAVNNNDNTTICKAP